MLTWVEQRTGAISAMQGFLTEDVPGGASYWYIFGSATMFALILQIVTGIFLTFYYAPSAATAWESTKFIYDDVPMGKFVISLHYWGATAMIALLAMHLLQVLIWGAYKKPREVQWIVGVFLFLFTMVMGLTGYLLPWDLNAFFASQVAINISGTVPGIGPYIQSFLQDGNTIGTLTINRFFGVHVWLMPALLILLTGMHLAIFRHNGAAGPPIDEAPKLKPGRFWPNQLFMDTVASFVVFAVIVLLSVFSPAPLDNKADPNQTSFQPYPAWYFLALFGLLNILPPWAELFGTVVLPGGLVFLLLVLPFIDRNPSRRPTRRPWLMAITAVSVIAAVGLSLQAQASIVARRALSGEGTPVSPAGASKLAQTVGAEGANAGNAPSGQAGVTQTSALASGPGAKIYAANCQACHQPTGQGVPGTFPPLVNNPAVTGDPKAVIAILLNGKSGPLTVNGQKYNGQMPAWKGTLSDDQIAAVATFIRNSWGNKASPITAKQVAAEKK